MKKYMEKSKALKFYKIPAILCSVLVLILWSVGDVSGQVSLLSFQKENINYRKAIKEAKNRDKPVLAILYSPDHPVERPNKFINALQIAEQADVVPVVIDWADYPNKKPQKKIRAFKNPTWAMIHSDDVIINIGQDIVTDQEFEGFLKKGRDLYDKVAAAFVKKEESKNPNDILQFASVTYDTYDIKYTADVLDEYLKRANHNRISNDQCKEIIRIGSKYPFSGRLYHFIKERKNRLIALSGSTSVVNIQQSYILHDSRRKRLLDPYYVWERFEDELGYHADSLYRRFAITYFSSEVKDPEMLYNEAMDYINLYPRSPWSYLSPLYNMIISATSKKEDLDILLDLISFQLFREETHVKLDYKALILYKLGQKDRALGMINKINNLALAKGVRYKSLLYSLK